METSTCLFLSVLLKCSVPVLMGKHHNRSCVTWFVHKKRLELDILREEGHVVFRIKLFSIFLFKPKRAWKISPPFLLLLCFPGLIVPGQPSVSQSEQ